MGIDQDPIGHKQIAVLVSAIRIISPSRKLQLIIEARTQGVKLVFVLAETNFYQPATIRVPGGERAANARTASWDRETNAGTSGESECALRLANTGIGSKGGSR